MIISPKEFEGLSLEQAMTIVNSYISLEMETYSTNKARFIKDPLNNSMPEKSFTFWINLRKGDLMADVEEELMQNLKDSGWDIVIWEWQTDERTGLPKLFVAIREKGE